MYFDYTQASQSWVFFWECILPGEWMNVCLQSMCMLPIHTDFDQVDFPTLFRQPRYCVIVRQWTTEISSLYRMDPVHQCACQISSIDMSSLRLTELSIRVWFCIWISYFMMGGSSLKLSECKIADPVPLTPTPKRPKINPTVLDLEFWFTVQRQL